MTASLTASLAASLAHKGAAHVRLPAGTWRWLDGYPWGYTNWGSGYVNNVASGANENHLFMMHEPAAGWTGQWNDGHAPDARDNMLCACMRRGEHRCTDVALLPAGAVQYRTAVCA